MTVIDEWLAALDVDLALVRQGCDTSAEALAFWSSVDVDVVDSDCWLWTGRVNDKGYGCTGFRGKGNVGAHRIAWALTHDGQLPGEWVLHECDNPPCVRPSHLFLGDALANNRDRQSKGRTRGWAGRAEAEHHAFRVDLAMTAAMCSMRHKGATQQQIADRFAVSRGHVSKILRGQTVASRKAVA